MSFDTDNRLSEKGGTSYTFFKVESASEKVIFVSRKLHRRGRSAEERKTCVEEQKKWRISIEALQLALQVLDRVPWRTTTWEKIRRGVKGYILSSK